jgi:hypothetical protein
MLFSRGQTPLADRLVAFTDPHAHHREDNPEEDGRNGLLGVVSNQPDGRGDSPAGSNSIPKIITTHADTIASILTDRMADSI